MTFSPDQRSPQGMPFVVRTILFWVLMIVLAVVLWRMASQNNAGRGTPPAPAMSYSEFMNHVDRNNVASAHLYESQSTAVIEGQLREPPDKFRVTVPKESVAELTERLRKQGVTIDVSEVRDSARRNLLLDLGPFIVIIFTWIALLMRRRKPRGVPPAPVNPENRPLG